MPFALPHMVAGLIAVLVGYTSSVVLIIQAATAAGADAAQVSSWLWTLGIGMGVSCICLSLYYRIPVLTAWSTPGAALLITSLGQFQPGRSHRRLHSLLAADHPLRHQRLVRSADAPHSGSLAAAMLAGVLLRFGLDLFKVAPRIPCCLAPCC